MPNANSGNGRFFQLTEVGNQLPSQYGKLCHGGVAATLQIGALDRPMPDFDRFQGGPRLAEHSMNPQAIEVRLAITDVPEVLQERRLVAFGLTLKQFRRQCSKRMLKESGHLGELAQEACVGLPEHFGVRANRDGSGLTQQADRRPAARAKPRTRDVRVEPRVRHHVH